MYKMINKTLSNQLLLTTPIPWDPSVPSRVMASLGRGLISQRPVSNCRPKRDPKGGDPTEESPRSHFQVTLKSLKHRCFFLTSPFSDPPLGAQRASERLRERARALFLRARSANASATLVCRQDGEGREKDRDQVGMPWYITTSHDVTYHNVL